MVKNSFCCTLLWQSSKLFLVAFVCTLLSKHEPERLYLNPKHMPRPIPPQVLAQALPPSVMQRHKETHLQAIEQAQQMRKNAAKQLISTSENWQFTGPTNIGGRITDVEMPANDSLSLYIGTANGGIFKTNNFGKEWQPIFDDQPTLTIGDIAIAPSQPETLYVGTGEANGGGGSIAYDGLGIFKTTNGGKTWASVGLPNSGNIGRIAIDAQNPNRVFVAAMGKLFANNDERGVFRTIDGGKTWEKVLFIDNKTGAIDIIIHPTQPKRLYAVLWERQRNPAQNMYGGANSGIWTSNDGGNSWQQLKKGLPTKDIGRISLALAPSQPQILYTSFTDSQGNFKQLYKSENGGNSWKKLPAHHLNPKEVYADYGWWFGGLRVHPQNPDIVYLLGIDVLQSTDGGNSWKNSSKDAIHYDQHAMVISPQHPKRIIVGNDGGLYLSANGGKTWQWCANLPITQYYTCHADRQIPYRYYGGSQDNGVLLNADGAVNGWQMLLDGDGFGVLSDPYNSRIIYAEYQYGNLGKSTDGGKSFYAALKGIPYEDRRNWNTPFIISPTNSSVLYYGTQRLYKSTNKAKSWKPISSDLTKGNPQYPELTAYGTITAIAASPANANILYVGTDDGNLHCSRDGGDSWINISQGTPQIWVTHLAPHPIDTAKVLVSFSGYRTNDLQAYVYQSNDYGKTWNNIADGLPTTPVNDIIIDNLRPNTLYVATDLGVYKKSSTENWTMLGSNLPNIPITDLDLHPQYRYLLAATYGRGIYRYDLIDANANKNTKGTSISPFDTTIRYF